VEFHKAVSLQWHKRKEHLARWWRPDCSGTAVDSSSQSPARRTVLAALFATGARSLALIARVFDRQPEDLTRDEILDNITLYWLTNTAVSSARLCLRSWTGKGHPKLIYYDRLPKGRAFRRIGTAATFRGGDPCRVQLIALGANKEQL